MSGLGPLLPLGMIMACGLLAPAAEFSASVVKVDITPSASKWLAGYPARQSTGVHDRLYHRIVAMDDGHTQFFLVASDLCLFDPSVYDEATAQLQKETGIQPVQVWWTVTHTHSAPEVGPHGLLKLMMPERYKHEPDREYTAFVERAMIDGIQKARSALVPARLAFGAGYSAANINRRARDVDGSISLGLNPDGPTDRQIGLMRLERADGSMMALIANYAMHGTALGPHNTLISGDAPGTVENYVEEKLGVPMLYVNGAAGNLAPIYTVQEDFKAAHITEFNVLLGNRILAANRSLAPASGSVSVRVGERFVETPRRESGTLRFPIRFAIFARPVADARGSDDELAIWSAPVELFCEIAMQVRSRSPYPYTFYFGYANGWLGYLPTRAAFSEGGYETQTNPFTDRVEDDLTKAALTYLAGHGR